MSLHRAGRASLLRISGLIVLVAMVALGSFLLTRALNRGDPAQAGSAESVAPAQPAPDPQTGEEREPWWFVPLLEADEEEPRFDGTINGIRIGPDVTRTLNDISPCRESANEEGIAELVDAVAARGTPLEVAPRYLPAGTSVFNEDQERAGRCGDVIITAGREYVTQPDVVGGRWSASIVIVRMVVSPPMTALSVAESRVRSATIAGRPAVIVDPFTADGFGDSAVVIREPWGITLIQANGLPTSEIVQIAESLYEPVPLEGAR